MDAKAEAYLKRLREILALFNNVEKRFSQLHNEIKEDYDRLNGQGKDDLRAGIVGD